MIFQQKQDFTFSVFFSLPLALLPCLEYQTHFHFTVGNGMSTITVGFIRSYYTQRRLYRAVKGDANLAPSSKDEFKEFHQSGCVFVHQDPHERTRGLGCRDIA